MTLSRTLRIIVNGKSAGDPALRAAVKDRRDRGQKVEIRVTWESGDAARYARDAVADGIDVIVAAGGDGTVNEVAGGMLSTTDPSGSALAVIPYGTANDFASGCGIPIGNPTAALQLAAPS